MLVNENLSAVCGDSLECQYTQTIKNIKKIRKARDIAYRAETKRIKDKYKDSESSKNDLIKDIQKNVFNPFIKLRDSGEPCISCNKHEYEIKNFKQWHAGHYLGTGARKDIRFNEDNCHKQCSGCNQGENHNKAKEASTSNRYRHHLVNKIGLERVEKLEVYNIHRYTYDELIEIKKHFSDKFKRLKNEAKHKLSTRNR